MNKRLQKQKDEPLYQWCNRIADELKMNEQQRDALKNVSKESWIVGVNAERELRKKYG